MRARDVGRVLLRAARSAQRAATPQRRGQPGSRPPSGPAPGARLGYAPVADDRADPGEVVWAWVPYEEDASQGKDRPVLVVGRDGPLLLALPLTSQDHDRDAAQEARAGRHWVDVGSGGWDHRRRPSEARVDRLLRLEPGAVRRTGAQLDRGVFDRVVAQVRRHYPGL
ncbi:type II toxin-antitoxin system PemK/MazF family toxin [Serinicoccus chungangensis]|uniref:type II toxin-antitoxin system PemK/MazF family toxin n=1 Tax=Serinicoccus chungangensis TaxID=767452 RepID=UPI001117B98A|nr:type II toxin-antitoxin system PemK/MazF family toxin [Serinicoccus chungangensis]